MRKTPYYSFAKGPLPKGCRLCVKGAKMVVFATGICGQTCFYCPLSEQKKGADRIFANEWPDPTFADMITEARLTDAQGAGITGGDPLSKLDKTIRIIQKLKQAFGKGFHIHLYTPLPLVTPSRLAKLHKAGLDEIRFHPDLACKEHWQNLRYAEPFAWDRGIEIPVIPGMMKETKELIDRYHGSVMFINLNELEYSDTNSQQLTERGLYVKDPISYGIKESIPMGMKLIGYAIKKGYRMNMHLCTAKLKDGIQLARRIKRRAKNVRKKYDHVTKYGTLIRGAVYAPGILPGQKRKADGRILKMVERDIRKATDIAQGMIEPDPRNGRVLVSVAIAKRLCKTITHDIAIVEEYPTYDGFTVEVDVLQDKRSKT